VSKQCLRDVPGHGQLHAVIVVSITAAGLICRRI